MSETRMIKVLIAALGGEGGGVLTNWIIEAANRAGFPVQSTSIPGVAQRTGATTYYVEIYPAPAASLNGRRPLFALTPGVGDVDLAVSSELMETGRVVANGFVTRDRTTVVASTSRFFAINEKIAMGDGRADPARLIKAIQDNSKQSVLFDMERVARENGAMINAIMLGAIAGCGLLPISNEIFEAAIGDDGKAVEVNVRGFRAGLEATRQAAGVAQLTVSPKRGKAATRAALEAEVAQAPEAAREVMLEGVRRLVGYQGVRYARRYLDRLGPVREADARANAGGRLLRDTARHLAVRMSYEDVIRVAQAKIDPERLARIAKFIGAKGDEPFDVVEFFKPGIEEIAQILPYPIGRSIVDVAAKRGWLDRLYFGMEVKTTSISGFLRVWFLAKLRPLRPFSLRFHDEQIAIDHWLALIGQGAKLSADLAIEIAECARLIKGYGDTHKRGTANYQTIEQRIIQPVLAGTMPPGRAIDAIASARLAALKDPEGESLANCLAAIEEPVAPRIAAE
jgi:indolepyruvate ferredoxin oxidoreductase beta subunit